MNCQEANKIPIINILKSIYNCDPDNISRDEIKYKSPSRNERTASLFVNPQKNIWKDFGTGKGGGSIDLVCYVSNVDIKEALSILSRMEPARINFSFSLAKSKEEFKLQHIQNLQNKALINYLSKRCIPYQIALKVPQLKEAYWKYNDKNFFALAWINDEGGCELRNGIKSINYPSGYKGGTKPKTITTIQGYKNELNIFEGFFDYLSALVYFKYKSLNTSIILNSVSNINKVDFNKYAKINMFLDNDNTGKTTSEEITNKHKNTVNRSIQIFPDHKDFNEFLKHYKNGI